MSDGSRVVEINDSCYLDTESHMLAIQVDRVTFTLCVDEFLDFYLQLAEVKDFFDACPDYVLGKTMDSDVRGIFIPRPDESEYT